MGVLCSAEQQEVPAAPTRCLGGGSKSDEATTGGLEDAPTVDYRDPGSWLTHPVHHPHRVKIPTRVLQLSDGEWAGTTYSGPQFSDPRARCFFVHGIIILCTRLPPKAWDKPQGALRAMAETDS